MSVVRLPPNLSRPEQQLVGVVSALAAEDPAGLPEGLALERLRVVLAQAEALKLVALQGLADLDARQLYAQDGARSTNAWLKGQAVSSVRAPEITLAKRLAGLPRLKDEVLAGTVSTRAAEQVAQAVAKAKPFLDRPDGLIDGQAAEPALHNTLVNGISQLLAEQTGGSLPEHEALRAELEQIVEAAGAQRDRLEAALVRFAQHSQPSLLAGALGLLLDALLPAEHDRRAAAAEEKSQFDLARNPGGSGWIPKGLLDDETGELLHTLLAAVRATDPDNPADTDAWRAAAQDPDVETGSPSVWPAGLARPRSKRRQQHDALKTALRKLLDAGLLGLRDKVRPHLLITVSLDYVNGIPGALPARAASGAFWTLRQLRAIAADSVFTRVVLDAQHRPIERSYPDRTLRGPDRLLENLLWGGRCAAMGCDRGLATGDKIVPHHKTPYATCTSTSLDDSAPLCEQDHHELHHNGRVLHLKNGEWIGPDAPVDPPEAGRGRPPSGQPRGNQP